MISAQTMRREIIINTITLLNLLPSMNTQEYIDWVKLL